MKTAIVSNKNISGTNDVVRRLEREFIEHGIEYDFPDINQIIESSSYDLVCAVGGDGTILKTACCFAKTKTPVLGINLGRLGFLSLLPPDNINILSEMILQKKYEIKERIMLKSSGYIALNDFVIKGHSPQRSTEFNLFINGRLVSGYIADGIIISTPTGSTAYGLSAGGPILYPDLDAFVIVPICAHTMTARPLVVPAASKITVRSADEYLDAACDGQQMISKIKEIEIELYEYKAKLAFPAGNNFYSILKNKLYWGISPAL